MWLSRTFFILSGCLFGLIPLLTAQTCLPNGYSFQSQAQVNNFLCNYPGCVEILGHVSISGDLITDLSGLSQLQKVDDRLSIWLNTSLTNLQGLNNLKEVTGDLEIRWNNKLNDLSGLSALTTIGGDLYFQDDDALTSLQGLGALTSIGGDFQIWDVQLLKDLNGINQLDSVWGSMIIKGNYGLDSLSGLDNLAYVGNNMEISDLSLTDLRGLNELKTIGADLHLSSNLLMESMNGLDHLTHIGGDLHLESNNLITLDGLNSLTDVGGSVIIEYNNSLASISGIEGLTSIGGDLVIYGAAELGSLSELSSLSSIMGTLRLGYCPKLESLNGLAQIDPAGIQDLLIANCKNLSTCEVQSICSYLSDPLLPAAIMDNSVGCASRPQVEEACMINAVDGHSDAFQHTIGDPYPNPTSGPFSIDTRDLVVLEMTLTDPFGRTLPMETLVNTNGQWDIRTVPPGLYYIHIQTNQGHVVKKLVRE